MRKGKVAAFGEASQFMPDRGLSPSILKGNTAEGFENSKNNAIILTER